MWVADIFGECIAVYLYYCIINNMSLFSSLNFLKKIRRFFLPKNDMPTWLALECEKVKMTAIGNVGGISCPKAIELTKKAMKELMLSDDQAKIFFNIELNYQRNKKLIGEQYFYDKDLRDEHLTLLLERKLQEIQAILDSEQWALNRVESI